MDVEELFVGDPDSGYKRHIPLPTHYSEATPLDLDLQFGVVLRDHLHFHVGQWVYWMV